MLINFQICRYGPRNECSLLACVCSRVRFPQDTFFFFAKLFTIINNINRKKKESGGRTWGHGIQ